MDEKSVVKNYFTTTTDGEQHFVLFYSLEMITVIGFQVLSVRGTQFRRLAKSNLTEFLIKGFVMDDRRLKNPNPGLDFIETKQVEDKSSLRGKEAL